jgi:hypothetical protein
MEEKKLEQLLARSGTALTVICFNLRILEGGFKKQLRKGMKWSKRPLSMHKYDSISFLKTRGTQYGLDSKCAKRFEERTSKKRSALLLPRDPCRQILSNHP